MADLLPENLIDAPAAQRVLRVLLLEDNQFVRRALARNLRRLTNLSASTGERVSFEVVEEDESEGALRMLERGEVFDLVITDFYLPVISGYELISRLRSFCPATPLIVISAADALTLSEIPDTGADIVMQKPVRAADLPAPLAALLHLAIAPSPLSRLVWQAGELSAQL